MSTWILHCHLGRRRVELPDPPTPDAVRAALERVSPRPGWLEGAIFTPVPSWEAASRIAVHNPITNLPLAALRRSTSRSQHGRVSIYLPPALRDQLQAEADARGVTVSELGYRLIDRGLNQLKSVSQ